MVVSQIFRKAQNEKNYSTLYGRLCENIIQTELKNLGIDKITKAEIKKSTFRESLIEQCRISFMEFVQKKDEEVKELDEEEKEKKKKKLLGNIFFIGELYVKNILQDVVLKVVFFSMLGYSYENERDPTVLVTDDSVEGIINLMSILGPHVDPKLNLP